MNKIKAPKRIPAEIMRKFTREQLKVIATQKNTKGNYSVNAYAASQILHYDDNRTHFATCTIVPCSKSDKGFRIPINKSVELDEWLNGTENLKLLNGKVVN